MECEVCFNEVSGNVDIIEYDLGDGIHVLDMAPSPNRNWITCDACNKVVCFACCRYPQSGYCDTCIEHYGLYDLLLAEGLIRQGKGEARKQSSEPGDSRQRSEQVRALIESL